MALKGFECWDIYHTANIADFWQSAGNSSIVLGAGRCNSDALFNNTNGGDGPIMGVHTSSLGGFQGSAFKPGTLGSGAVAFRVLNIDGGVILFTTANTDGSMSWWSGPNTTLGVRMVSTPPNLLSVGRYDHVGYDWMVSGGSSYLRIYINTILYADFSGSITFGGFAPSNKAWKAFELVHPLGGYYDDHYWGDADSSDAENPYTSVAQLGDLRIEGQLPLTDADGGGGHYQDFIPNTGTDHGALVREDPPDGDTTYVASGVVGNKETFKYPALSIVSGTVYGVQNMPDVKKSDPGTRLIANLLYEGSTLTTGDNLGPSQTNYTYQVGGRTGYLLWAKNPRTPGVNFTATQINSAEHGIEVTG